MLHMVNVEKDLRDAPLKDAVQSILELMSVVERRCDDLDYPGKKRLHDALQISRADIAGAAETTFR